MGFLVALGLCLLCLAPGIARAETIEFETGTVNTPFDGTSHISFPSLLGFRPYFTDVGGRAHSGTKVGDLGRCVQEAEANGEEPEGCLSFQARTTGLLTQTASSVTVFVGRIGAIPPEPEQAVLTAFDAEGNVVGHPPGVTGVGSAGPDPISETFNRNLTVESGAGDIAQFRVEARLGPTGAIKAGAEDLGVDDVSVNFTGGSADFVVSTTSQVVPVIQGEQVDVPVHVHRLNDSNGEIDLQVFGLPDGVSSSSPRLTDTQSNATITLSAEPSATDTHFVPTTASVVARPLSVTSGARSRSAPLSVRVGTNFELSSNGITEADNTKLQVEAPDCAPVDVPLKVSRDIAFNQQSVALGVRADEPSDTELPVGVNAEFLPEALVPSGGGLVNERTLRFRTDWSQTLHPALSLIVEGRADATSPQRSLQVNMTRAQPRAKIDTTAPGSGIGITPRFGREGSRVRINGTGFCPETKVVVGNDYAVVPATLVDADTIEFTVPRYATSGRIEIRPPHLPPYHTIDELHVDSARNSDAFQFGNYPFGHLSLQEFTKAFGTDDVFVAVNPCWPFGKCRVVTGILNPLAAIDWGWMNVALPGTEGHCFGMSVAIQRLMSDKESYRQFFVPSGGLFAHPVAFEIPGPDGPDGYLNSFLDAQHAKQYSDEFLSAEFRRNPGLPKQVQTLEQAFSNNQEPMVVMNPVSREGHGVLAYDMQRTTNGFDIYVYDTRTPFTPAEDNPQERLHRAEVDNSVIHVNEADGTWHLYDTATELRGQLNDGSLWVAPLSSVPDDPSLPSTGALASALASISASFVGDSSGQTSSSSPGAQLLPALNGSSGAGDGTWVTDAGHPLEVTVEGAKAGHYTQLYTAPGFIATATGVATAKGVRDVIEGNGDSLTVASGDARPLELSLAKQVGDKLAVSATLDTHASGHGHDSVGITDGGALTYAHDGAPSTTSFTLTAMRRNGGPATFISGPIAVRGGERLRIQSLDRDMRRVRVKVRGAHGKTRTLVLRSRSAAPGRLQLGAPKVSRRRLSLPLKLSHFHGPAMVGAVLRLTRRGRVVARTAISLTAHNGKQKIRWRLPRGVAGGRYQLKAQVRAVSSATRGSTVAGSVSAQRAGPVRLGGA
jgi:hypothetical protein